MDTASEHTGIIGANFHRANQNGKSVQVDKWSVLSKELNEFLKDVEDSLK